MTEIPNLRCRSLGLAAGCATLLSVMMVSMSAHAQNLAPYDVNLTDSQASAGVDLFAAASAAGIGSNDPAGDPLAGALGVQVAADFWAWTKTSQVTAGDGGSRLSLWPIFGTRWGIEGGLSLSGHLRGCAACGGHMANSLPSLVQGQQWARLRTGFLDILEGASYQRAAEFDDAYWRPERHLSSMGWGFEIPFGLRYDSDAGVHFALFQFKAFGRELFNGPGSSVWGNLDFHFGSAPIRVRVAHTYSSFVGRFMAFDGSLFATPSFQGRTDNVVKPFEGSVWLADMKGITFDDGRHSFGLSLGMHLLLPATLESSDAIVLGAFPGALTLSFTNHEGMPRLARARRHIWRVFDALTYRVAAGTFARLGPSGFATDTGWKLHLSAALPINQQWSMQAKAVGITATRDAVEPAVVGAIPGLDHHFLMGRAELDVSRQLGDRLVLTMQAWAEHSDRFDPGLTGIDAAAPGQMVSRLGAVASLTAKAF